MYNCYTIDIVDIFFVFMMYSVVAAVCALAMDKKDNLLGRAFIWPIILLIAIVKAIRSVYLETKAEFKDCTNTVKKK